MPGVKIKRFVHCPPPTLRGKHQLDNAAAALAATVQLQSRLPIHMAAVRCGLVAVAHPCRFQVLPGTPVVVLDVAHNPHAARALADNLTQMAFFERTIAVMGMMADKDIPGVVAAVQAQMDDWFVTPLPLPRGADVQQIQQSLRACGVRAIQAFETPLAAYQAAMASAGERGRIVVFGSFLTVSPVWGAISGTL